MSYGTVNCDVVQSSDGLSLGAGNATLMKNKLINGACVIDQRNAGASVTITNTADVTYTLDRWAAYGSQSSKFSVQQNAGSVTPPVGFTNYLGATSASAYSVGASEFFYVQQRIEGFNTADLAWGTANAKTVTLSFQVYSSLTGTFGGSLINSSNNRSYPFSYSIPVANTWTSISVTIAGDTTGTWTTTNGTGINVSFNLGAGSTYLGTANTWAATRYYAPTGATSVVGTSGATWYATGIQIERGTSATGFEYRQYQQELALCQRYYEVGGYNVQAATSAGGVIGCLTGYKVTKRASPSVVGTASLGGAPTLNIRVTNLFETINMYATPDGNGVIAGSWSANAEL